MRLFRVWSWSGRALSLLLLLMSLAGGCTPTASSVPTAAPALSSAPTATAAPTAVAATTAATARAEVATPALAPTAPATPSPAPSATPSPAATVTPASTSTPETPEATVATWVSPDDGWLAVGGSVAVTHDAGSTWTKLSTLGGDVRALSFVDLDRGWAATASGLYSTLDGGKGWAKVSTGGTSDLLRVAFADGEHGWVLPTPSDGAGQQALLRTVDGGKSWTSLATPCPSLPQAAAFSFYDEVSGWLACGGEPGAGNQAKYVYRTSDGGSHWKLVSQTSASPLDASAPRSLPTSGYVADIFGRDESHAWLATSRGGLLHTSDGGRTWQPLTSLYGERFPTCPYFFSEERGYTLDTSGGQTLLLGTRDSGKAWKQLYP